MGHCGEWKLWILGKDFEKACGIEPILLFEVQKEVNQREGGCENVMQNMY
jgi:hypothetical protein